MKLNDDKLQWIYDKADQLKQAAVVCDFCRQNKTMDDTFQKANDMLHDLSFSFLMLSMGEHIPKTFWSVDDFSVLYGILTNTEELEISDIK